MKIHIVRKLIRSRFTKPWKCTPQDSTSSRRRICVDPWGGGVQGFLWRMHKWCKYFIRRTCYCSIQWVRKKSVFNYTNEKAFIYCFIKFVQRFKFKKKKISKDRLIKTMKNHFSSSKKLHKPRVQHHAGCIAPTLSSHLTRALRLLHLFHMYSFL